MKKLRKALTVATAACSLAAPALVLASPAAAAPPHNNASAQVAKTAAAETPRNDYDGNPRGFVQNNCTAFAAYRIASRLGRPAFKDNWGGQHWGDAQNWDNAARAIGITVNKNPTVGGIAVNDVHVSSHDGVLHGHVAYINKVYADGSFDVEEYNWNVTLGYGTRSHLRVNSGDSQFQHVIHF
jgi:surface antigen